MKILNRKQFLELPEGVLYTSGEPWAFGNIHIKGKTCELFGEQYNDWYEWQLDHIEWQNDGELFDRLEEMRNTGKSYPLDITQGRNGLFEDNELFLVYEKADLTLLINELKRCKGVDEL